MSNVMTVRLTFHPHGTRIIIKGINMELKNIFSITKETDASFVIHARSYTGLVQILRLSHAYHEKKYFKHEQAYETKTKKTNRVMEALFAKMRQVPFLR